MMRRLVLAAALLAPATAFAHPGHDHGAGFLAGVAHPFGGLDHLVAMVAVGLWAASFGTRRMALVLPGAFLGGMALGGLGGAFGPALPVVEYGVIGTAVLLAVAVAASLRLPVAASIGFVALAGVLHGYAHGAEMTAGSSLALYGAGFLAATATLHALGFGLAQTAIGAGRMAVVRGAGFCAAAVLLVSVFL
jgi:urease accessory protein